MIAVLIDPDKANEGQIASLTSNPSFEEVDLVFVGGSLVTDGNMRTCLQHLKQRTKKPLIIFPGSPNQIDNTADAIFLLSLISGRNADLLIGRHVESSFKLKRSELEILSTGYMLIDGGRPTTVSYMSNTSPIPAQKDDIAVCTAIAGEYLGLRQIFMDAGSGAHTPISTSMIEAVSGAIDIPLIVGGGIRTPEKVRQNAEAGADLIVVGDAIEKNPEILTDMVAAIRS